MITQTYVLDATTERRDRRVGFELPAIPAGARIIINVGTRWQTSPTLVAWLADAVITHVVDVHGNAKAVNAWTRALQDAA